MDDDDMTICDACGKEVPTSETYDGPDGGVVCPDCMLDAEEDNADE